MKKVLFICTANICRSPMAEALFNVLAEDGGLPFQAESAGTAALEGRPMASNAVVALSEIGVYPGVHRARQVSRALIDEAELVLTMGPQHSAALHRRYDAPLLNVYTLPTYATASPGEGEIPDPYGYSMVTYRSCLRQLHGYMDHLLDRLGG